jgi:hypothetical protein
VTGSAFSFVGVDEIGESTFYRYGDGGLDAGVTVTLLLPGPPFSAQRLVWVVVVLMAVALAVGFWLWQRNRERLATVVVPPGPDAIAAGIAALDRDFEARGGSVSAGERAEYERRRAELKSALAEALVRDGGGN